MSTDGQPKAVQIQTVVPGNEEPVFTIQIVACKSGAIYVGHTPGRERHAHALCVDGARTMYEALLAKAAEAMQNQSKIIGVQGSLDSLGLPRIGRDS